MKNNNENFRKAYNADPYEKSTKGWELETNGNEVHQFCKLFKHLCSINSLYLYQGIWLFNKPQTSKTKTLKNLKCNAEKISFECLVCFSQFSFPTMMKGWPIISSERTHALIATSRLTNCFNAPWQGGERREN